MVCINYQDTVLLADTTPDAYGTEEVTSQTEIGALVVVNSGYQHGAFQDTVNSDCVVFVDPSNEFVIENSYRLEEFLVQIPLFNTPDKNAWYKVISVDVNRDILLCNQIDSINLSLKKTGNPSINI